MTDDSRTLLVEANDGFSFGSYGLDPKLYVRMLAARWRELMEQPELPKVVQASVPWTVTVGPAKVT